MVGGWLGARRVNKRFETVEGGRMRRPRVAKIEIDGETVETNEG